MNNIRRNIPNIITLSNLLCGVCSIFFLINGNLYLSALLIILGAVFDFLDGLSARILNAYSKFGKQLDSFSDMITFGVAPSILLFKLFNTQGINYALEGSIDSLFSSPITLCLLIPVCSAIRLAKFNIENEQDTYFIGLPTPAVGLFISGLALGNNNITIFNNEFFLITISILLPILLISKIQLFSLKFKKSEGLKSKITIFRFCLIIGSIILFSVFWFAAIPFIVILYLILSIINNAII